MKYCFVIAALLLSSTAAFMSCMRGGTLQSLAVTPTQAMIAEGTSQQFTATATFTDGTTLNWTSAADWSTSHPDIVSVGTTSGVYGLVTALTTTTNPVTIIARDTVNNISATATVLITRTPLVSIQVTPVNPIIRVGETTDFTAEGTYADGTVSNLTTFVTWSSSNTAVATIGNLGSIGTATAVAAGTTTITATDPITRAFDSTVLIVE